MGLAKGFCQSVRDSRGTSRAQARMLMGFSDQGLCVEWETAHIMEGGSLLSLRGPVTSGLTASCIPRTLKESTSPHR